MKIYINGKLTTSAKHPFGKDFTFLPSDVILSSGDGSVRITLSSEESENSFRTTNHHPTRRLFSCRFRGVTATIEKDGNTIICENASFADIAGLLINHKMHLAGVEAYMDDSPACKIRVDSLSVFDGYLLADLSDGLDVKLYKEVLNEE